MKQSLILNHFVALLSPGSRSLLKTSNAYSSSNRRQARPQTVRPAGYGRRRRSAVYLVPEPNIASSHRTICGQNDIAFILCHL